MNKYTLILDGVTYTLEGEDLYKAALVSGTPSFWLRNYDKVKVEPIVKKDDDNKE